MSFQNRTGEELASLYQTPEQVAEVVIEVIENENPPLRVRTSEWAEQLCEFKKTGRSRWGKAAKKGS